MRRTTGGERKCPRFFEETTVGHTGRSDDFYAPYVSTFLYAADFDQMVWTPDDYTVDGTSITRSFKVNDPYNWNGPANTYIVVDGFEVTGYYTLTYDAIPENSTVMLFLGGLGGLVFIRRFAMR